MSMGRWLLGIPMRGMAEVDIEVAAPIENGVTKYSKAHGTIAMGCATGCVLGDDKAKLDLGPDMQVELGHLDFDKLALKMTVDNGHAKVTKWTLESGDLKLALDLDITLADNFSESKIDGCVRFAPTEGLMKRQPKTHALISTTGANMVGDMFAIRLGGTIGGTKRLAQACDVRPAP
jgi:hypothetical protein